MIRRNILSDILPNLDRDELLLILGARQVGKTTLLKQIISEIEDRQFSFLRFRAI